MFSSSSQSVCPLAVIKGLGVRGAKGMARLVGLGLVVGGAGLAWGLAETRAFRLRHHTITCEPNGACVEKTGETSGQRLRILHLSDLHLRANQVKKQKWVTSLASYEPDLVVLTGDLIAEAKALPVLLETLKPFLSIPAVYVYGSNDYYAPHFKNPFAYLLGPSSQREMGVRERVELPWRDMDAVFCEAGWVNLNNARGHLDVGEWSIDFVGVDDAHIWLDRYPVLSGDVQDVSSDLDDLARERLRIGVTHAPYTRVLDAMSGEECDVIFAGHTHGGQVCVPKFGALVTNCDLPREYASGLFQWPPSGDASCAWVNVSAGLGTSPFAPVRVACRPEAIVIDIVR